MLLLSVAFFICGKYSLDEASYIEIFCCYAYFAVDNIEEARAELISRGLEPVGEIQSDAGNFWCYFKDPEGNLYQITEGSNLPLR